MRSLVVLLLTAPAAFGADSVVSGVPDPPPVLAVVGRIEDRLARVEEKLDRLLTGGRPLAASAPIPAPVSIVAPGVQPVPFGHGPAVTRVITPATIARTAAGPNTSLPGAAPAAPIRTPVRPVGPAGITAGAVYRLNPPGSAVSGCSGSG